MGYSAQVYSSAKAEIEKRRYIADEELEMRRQDLYEKEPRAGEIERELVRISVAAGKAVLNGADKIKQLEQLRDKSLSLQEELENILKRRNLSHDYLDPWYSCKKCSDTGNIDGKMCDCMKHLLRQTAYEDLNRISPLSLSSFECFSVDYYPKDKTAFGTRTAFDYMQGVFRFCRNYAADFTENSESLLFQGGTGLGKTHLSLSIAQEVIQKGFGVIYVSAPNILSRLETKQFGGHSSEKTEDEQLLLECDLLIIDDLGTEFVTKFTLSSIYNIINTRLNMGKPVIISTNLNMKDLEQTYGTRMISRMAGMLKRIDFFGNDIRQIKRKNKY